MAEAAREVIGRCREIGHLGLPEMFEEFGGGAFPGLFLGGEGGDFAGERVGAEGGAQGVLGDSERRAGGDGPGVGIDEAASRSGGGSCRGCERETDGGTERSEQMGAGGFEFSENVELGAALGGGDGRKLDRDGVIGELRESIAGSGVRLVREGEENGTLEASRNGIGGGLIGCEGYAGGEAAQGARDRLAQVGHVIEGEDVMVPGQAQEFALIGRVGTEGGSSRIDEGAEQAGERGFAAGGGTLEDEYGIRADGAESGEEPGNDGGRIAGKEAAGQFRGGAERFGQRLGGAGAAEDGIVGNDVPAQGRDFDSFALGVGEIEQEGVGVIGVASEAGAEGKRGGRRRTAAGFGFEELQSVQEGAVGGEDFVFGVEGFGEPVAELDGANREQVVSGCARWNDGAGKAFERAARAGHAKGVVEEPLGHGGVGSGFGML